MASRKEEKERLRAERQAREEAERRAAARKQRLVIVGGVLAAAAAVALVVVFALGGDDGGNNPTGTDKSEEGPTVEVDQKLIAGVTIPPQTESDYEKAAESAGCTLSHPPIEGANHDEKEFTAADYKSNPPHSGDHNGIWYEDGIYDPGETERLGMLVHTLEHGRINLQYKPGTSRANYLKLLKFYDEQEKGYHMLVYENTTDMPYAVAATAWGHVLGCPDFNDQVWDALRTFRARYIDKGPENVP